MHICKTNTGSFSAFRYILFGRGITTTSRWHILQTHIWMFENNPHHYFNNSVILLNDIVFRLRKREWQTRKHTIRVWISGLWSIDITVWITTCIKTIYHFRNQFLWICSQLIIAFKHQHLTLILEKIVKVKLICVLLFSCIFWSVLKRHKCQRYVCSVWLTVRV